MFEEELEQVFLLILSPRPHIICWRLQVCFILPVFYCQP
jgi:hypothetical protein